MLFSGCLPERPDYIDELDLVYTNYSPTFHFTEQHTYAIPDKVVKVTGALPEGDSIQYVTPTYSNRILQNLRDQMNSKGWTEVDATADPDVILFPAVNTTTTVNYYYDYSYWGWYYPWYGYGGYYPGYYPPVVTSYKTGTLLVQMTYRAGVGDNEQVPVEWILVVDGLLEGSSSEMLNRIDRNITQGFEQSPYLDLK